jgi:PhnB protein
MARVEIQPELWVPDASAAVAFYQRAFGAVVEHRVGEPDDPNGIAQLSVEGARFWVTSASEDMGRLSPSASPATPSGDEHGWRLGRIKDPFGHEWEIGRPLGRWPPVG